MPVNAATVQPLQEAVLNVLNAKEQEEFIYFINQYNAKRNIQDLFWCLQELLDTPAKQQLVDHVQCILSGNDAESFRHLHASRSNGVPQSSTLTKKRVLQRDVGRPYQTLPTRGARVLHRPIAQTDFTGRLSQRPDLPNWEAGTGLPSQQPTPTVKTVYMEQTPGNTTGLGFSIRGGLEHGIGIYASYVEVDSLADRQGLVPGDQILSLNGVSFIKISHDEAAKLIQSSKKLEMEVRNVGRVPGSFETHQKYTWVDATGRTVSPPPEVDKSRRYETGHGVTGERKSNLMLLKDSDERKINLAIYDHRSLGIMIRGGNEFGLGIYVTGIDQGSPAEQAGLKVGDQIMDVNGNSFLDIGHQDAAKLLRSSQHLMMTVKDVGKLPHTRTTHDQMQWIVGQRSASRNHSTKSAPATPSFHHPQSTSIMDNHNFNGDNSIFSRGAGSQLMHTSLQTQKTQYALVEDSSRHLLNDSERETLRYYLAKYSQGHLTAADLATALLKLLNTQSKMDLVDEVRGVLAAPDLEKFDAKITNHNIKSLKTNKKKKRPAPSPPTAIPLSKSDQHKHSLSSLSSNGHSSHSKNSHRGREEDPLRRAIEQICEERELDMPFDTEREIPVVTPPESISGSNSSVVVVEVHMPYVNSSNTKASQCYDDMRSPSEDSGVDINGTSDSVKSHGTSKQSQMTRNRLFDHGRRYAPSGPDDSDGSQELDLSSWASHPPEVTYSIPHKTEKREKSKNWKEVALAKQNRRRSKSLVDLIGNLEAEHDNSLDKDNYLLKEQANDAKILHPSEFVLKDIPIAVNLRAKSVSPSSSWRKPVPHGERSPSSRLAECRNWNAVEDNSSDDYSIVSYSRIKSIQETSLSDKHQSDKSKSITWDPREDTWINSESNWRRRQVFDSEYTNPLPPPPDFSDSDDGKSPTVEPPRLQHLQDRFHLTAQQNVPSKPPRRSKSPGVSKPIQSSRVEDDGRTRGAIRVIHIQKLRPTLGIAIEGGANTKQPLPRVIQIQKTGSAALSDLEVGHIILKVNGRSMEELLHQDCARTIAEAFKNKTSSTIELQVKETKRKIRV